MNITENNRKIEINRILRQVGQLSLSIGPQYKLWWWEDDGEFSMFYDTLDFMRRGGSGSILVKEFVKRVGSGKIVRGPLKVASTDRMVAVIFNSSQRDAVVIQPEQIAAGVNIYCLNLLQRSGINIEQIRVNDSRFLPESDYFLPLSFTGKTR
ncbi:MAG: hypothetical protein AAB874_05865 [Patescibacteria group bacterium]